MKRGYQEVNVEDHYDHRTEHSYVKRLLMGDYIPYIDSLTWITQQVLLLILAVIFQDRDRT